MGLERGFYGFGLWKMKFLNIPLFFDGFVLLVRCLSATYCTEYYAFKRMKLWKKSKDCWSSIKKIWIRQGLNPWLQGERPATKPRGLVHIKGIILHLAELATPEFWLNLHHSRRPKQTFVKYASFIYEPGATKLLFFFNSGPKKALSLSLHVKFDQQTHKKKWCLHLWHQSQENYPTKSHNNSANAPCWGMSP